MIFRPTTLREAKAMVLSLRMRETNAVKLQHWDVSQLTDFSKLFAGASDLNWRENFIAGWDMSCATNLSGMFESNVTFNEDISGWDVSNVTDLSLMFSGAIKFNQPIGGWNVSKVTNMSFLFNFASSFNQPIGGWDVSNVTNMMYLLSFAWSFNQSIGEWNVSKVSTFELMFFGASQFNQSIADWKIRPRAHMGGMFGLMHAMRSPIFDLPTAPAPTAESKLAVFSNTGVDFPYPYHWHHHAWTSTTYTEALFGVNHQLYRLYPLAQYPHVRSFLLVIRLDLFHQEAFHHRNGNRSKRSVAHSTVLENPELVSHIFSWLGPEDQRSLHNIRQLVKRQNIRTADLYRSFPKPTPPQSRKRKVYDFIRDGVE